MKSPTSFIIIIIWLRLVICDLDNVFVSIMFVIPTIHTHTYTENFSLCKIQATNYSAHVVSIIVSEEIQVTNFFELTFLFDQISIHMLMSDKQ
jgi:hypothetical protein